jgi:hypothetical protein
VTADRQEFLHAWVPHWAAVFISRDYCDQLEAKGHAFLARPGMEAIGRDCVIGARQLREQGRVRWEAHLADLAASGNGRTEVPIAGADASSEGVLLHDRRLGTGQVAEMLRVTPRRVVQMIHEEKLSATWEGGRWWIEIEESSVPALVENRSQDE